MTKDWDIIITNKSHLWSIDFHELWRYRDLLTMYVKRDIVTFYKQTILGPLWFVIQPLFTTIMFMFVFGGIAGISTDGIPQAVFYLAGLVCWNYFQDCLSKCSSSHLWKGLFPSNGCSAVHCNFKSHQDGHPILSVLGSILLLFCYRYSFSDKCYDFASTYTHCHVRSSWTRFWHDYLFYDHEIP